MADYNSGSKQFEGAYAISTDENPQQTTDIQANANYGGVNNSDATINITNRSGNIGGGVDPDHIQSEYVSALNQISIYYKLLSRGVNMYSAE